MRRDRREEPSGTAADGPQRTAPTPVGKTTLTQSLLEPAPPLGRDNVGSHAAGESVTGQHQSARPSVDIAALFGRPVVAGRSAAPLDQIASGGGQRGAAVQRTPASSVPALATSGADPQIAPPKEGIDRSGFIDNSEGANIRTGPRGAGGRTVHDKPLPPATRVFVSGTHPTAPEWWYVTATLHDKTMVRGYV
jgi:hypothetical protein